MIPWVLCRVHTAPTPTALTVTSYTNIPDHLFMFWQYWPPRRFPIYKIIRGKTIQCGYKYAWANPHIAEQTAWGNTIDHNFYIKNLTPRSTIWFHLAAPGGPHGKHMQGPLMSATLPPSPPDIIYVTTPPGAFAFNILKAGIPRAYHASSFTPVASGYLYSITVKMSVYDPLHTFAIHLQIREGPDDQPPNDTLELSPTIISALTVDRLPHTFLFPDNRLLLAETQYWALIYRTDTSFPNVVVTAGGVAQPYSGYNANGSRPWTPEIGQLDILAEGSFLPGPPPYDLEIGSDAIDRIGSLIPTYTAINSTPLSTTEGEPPPAGGNIDQVDIWATEPLVNVKVGTFARDGDKFTCRAFAYLGTIPWGSKQTHKGLNLAVEPGDCLGIYYSSGEIDAGTDAESSIFYHAGDQFETGQQTYSEIPTYALSLHGLGWTFP